MRLSIWRLSYFGRPACLWWGLCDVAAGDVEGACVVVDVGDVGMCVVLLAGGCLGLWAARDVRGGGCYEWATWWQAVVELVVVG